MIELAKILVSGVDTRVIELEAIPEKISGATVRFIFDDPMWDGLIKNAVFAGSRTVSVLNVGDTAEIPMEAVSRHGPTLRVGLCGTAADGKVVIPTLYANLGPIRPAADPGADPSADPALPVWAQLQAEIESLKESGGPGGGIGEETDPTVPNWAKAPTKPSYVASEVGADPKGTAVAAVSEHNTGATAHSDIRLELKALNDRLTAFFDSDDQTLDELSEIVAYITSNKALIDAITTSKVSVSDIVNNLTTNVTNKPLSAAMGVELKRLLDENYGGNVDLTGYAKELWVQENYQPKGEYLTEVPEGYAKTDDIPTKPEDIGAQPEGDYALRSEIPSVPVQSVNGKTGAVSLSASDVKARPDTWMPSASDVGAMPNTTKIPAKTSDLTNDSGFITGYTETDPTVPAWAKQSEKPSYSKSEVGLGDVANERQYSAKNPPPYPVTSVNGKTGDVIIEADKYDPTVYGLPVLHLTGDTTGISKDNAVTLSYAYGENSGSCTLKWQGSSSLAYDKKNYTIKLDSAIDVGWGSQKKYCLKANFIDHSHARNIVSAKLWGQMVASRSGVHSTLKTCPNYGAVDGFPIAIMLNGEFHGLYTWNIPKDKWTFNLGSGTQEAVICADVDSPAVDLRVHSTVTEKVDHALEEVTDEDNAGWVATSLNNLIDRCVNSYGADLDTTIAQYMDWNSAIDYMILTVLIDGRDMYKKNYIMVTYDGTKWIWSAYDMDSTYGLQWAGKEIYPANDGISFVKFRVNRVMELIYRFKTNALKSRYKALRSSVLSEENISVMFENFVHGIPSTLYDADIRKWPSVPGSSVVTVDQILRWLTRRLAVVDKWIDELPAQETPVAPSAREGNVVPASVDKTGEVYNGTGYKDGFTIEIENGVESEVAAEGCCITGFIPVTKDNVIKVTTDSWNASPEDSRIIFYDMEKKPMALYTQPGYVSIFNEYTDATSIKWKQYQSVTYGTDGMTTLNIAYGASCTKLGYIRIRGVGKGANLAVIREGEVPDHAIDPETPAYTNQVPLSKDTDGSVFNGKGYQDGLRLSSSGTTKAATESTVTGFIPAKAGDVIRIYGVEWYSDTGNYICAYDSSFNLLSNFYGEFKSSSPNVVFKAAECSVLNDTDAMIKIGDSAFTSVSPSVAYIRVSSQGLLASRNAGIKQTGANMIVTVNEEITD